MTRWEENPPGVDITAASAYWTYILRWIPAYATGSRIGWWELQSVAEYESGSLPDDAILDAPRDTPADALAPWAASRLGYPVTLVKSHSGIRRRWWSWQREPVYYITPAVTP